METITCTPADMAAAFTEWERRYREEPERFMSEAQKLLTQTPETYGEACAPYFLQLLREAGAYAAAQSRAPARKEYKVVELLPSASPLQHMAEVRAYHEGDGWRLVSVVCAEGRWLYYMERDAEAAGPSRT